MSEIVNMMNVLVGAVNSYDYECTVNRLDCPDGDEVGIERLGKVYFHRDYNVRPVPDYVLSPDDKGKNAIAIAPADIRRVEADANGTLALWVERWDKDEHGNVFMRRTAFDFKRINDKS